MRRTPIALGLSLVSFASALALAPAALAHGIIVVGDADPVPGAGGSASPVRLAGHEVTVQIDDAIADVTVEQTFHSDAETALEGTYLFPLPPGAVVSKFAMTMAGKMVEGEVVEATKARSVYEG